jgi:NAD(P)-dependent dehydrogenase (short-subunit alcohol dehydrogenase family)
MVGGGVRSRDRNSMVESEMGYLVSEDADYVTGQTFTIDGGLTMNLGQGA